MNLKHQQELEEMRVRSRSESGPSESLPCPLPPQPRGQDACAQAQRDSSRSIRAGPPARSCSAAVRVAPSRTALTVTSALRLVSPSAFTAGWFRRAAHGDAPLHLRHPIPAPHGGLTLRSWIPQVFAIRFVRFGRRPMACSRRARSGRLFQNGCDLWTCEISNV